MNESNLKLLTEILREDGERIGFIYAGPAGGTFINLHDCGGLTSAALTSLLPTAKIQIVEKREIADTTYILVARIQDLQLPSPRPAVKLAEVPLTLEFSDLCLVQMGNLAGAGDENDAGLLFSMEGSDTGLMVIGAAVDREQLVRCAPLLYQTVKVTISIQKAG